MAAYDVRHFCTADGIDVFGEWLDKLGDRQAADIARAVRYWREFQGTKR